MGELRLSAARAMLKAMAELTTELVQAMDGVSFVQICADNFDAEPHYSVSAVDTCDRIVFTFSKFTEEEEDD